MIMYTKMVPHNIEGMMLGFAWGLIKFNADVLGRLITVGLNLKFMVLGEQGLMQQEMALAALEASIKIAEGVDASVQVNPNTIVENLSAAPG